MVCWICFLVVFGIVIIENILCGNSDDGCLFKLLKVLAVLALVILGISLVVATQQHLDRTKKTSPQSDSEPQADVIIVSILMPQPPPPFMP